MQVLLSLWFRLMQVSCVFVDFGLTSFWQAWNFEGLCGFFFTKYFFSLLNCYAVFLLYLFLFLLTYASLSQTAKLLTKGPLFLSLPHKHFCLFYYIFLKSLSRLENDDGYYKPLACELVFLCIVLPAAYCLHCVPSVLVCFMCFCLDSLHLVVMLLDLFIFALQFAAMFAMFSYCSLAFSFGFGALVCLVSPLCNSICLHFLSFNFIFVNQEERSSCDLQRE